MPQVKNIEYVLDKIKKIIDISPQETSVAMNLTVKENLEFFQSLYDVNDEEYFNLIVDSFSLREVLNKRAKTLSGGWQRRLSIAVSLISKPKIIFLDEPTAFLDFPSKVEMMQMLQGLAHDMGKTVFLSTHDLELALQIADKLWLLDAENLVTGTPKELAKEGYLDHFFNIPGILFNKENLTYQIGK